METLGCILWGMTSKMQLFILLTLLKGLIIFENLISEGERTTDTNHISSYQLQQLIQCWGFDVCAVLYLMCYFPPPPSLLKSALLIKCPFLIFVILFHWFLM